MHYLIWPAQIAALLLLIATFWSVFSSYPRLPARIATHFGLSGRPDQYGPRWTIWILPGIALIEYISFTGLAQLRAPRELADLFVFIKAETLALLWYVAHEQIKVSLGEKQRMGPFIWVLLVLLFATVFGIRSFH